MKCLAAQIMKIPSEFIDNNLSTIISSLVIWKAKKIKEGLSSTAIGYIIIVAPTKHVTFLLI